MALGVYIYIIPLRKTSVKIRGSFTFVKYLSTACHKLSGT